MRSGHNPPICIRVFCFVFSRIFLRAEFNIFTPYIATLISWTPYLATLISWTTFCFLCTPWIGNISRIFSFYFRWFLIKMKSCFRGEFFLFLLAIYLVWGHLRFFIKRKPFWCFNRKINRFNRFKKKSIYVN